MFALDDVRLVWSPSDLRAATQCRYAFLRCLEVLLGRAEPSVATADPMARQLAALGERHEAELLSAYERIGTVVRPGLPEWPRSEVTLRDAARRTQEALGGDADTVYQATFFDGEMLGHADFLEHAADGWRVCDAKLARSESALALVQVGAYAEQLGRLDVPTSRTVSLLLGSGRRRDVAVADVVPVYRSLREGFRALVREHVERGAPVHWDDAGLVACGGCDVCIEAAQEHRDVLLVAGVHRRQRDQLRDAGVRTVEALAAADDPPADMPPATFTRLRTQAELQASTPDGGVRHLLTEDAPATLARLPAPSAGDLFFDFEGDPHYDEGDRGRSGIQYLWGTLDAEGAYEPVWAHTFAQERQVFEDFVDLLTARRERWPDLHVYHYAAYETVALKRMAMIYRTREEELDDLLRGEVFVDLYAVVRGSVMVSERSYSIKKLEPLYMGEELRAEDGVSSGDVSIEVYHRFRALREEDPRAATEQLDALADYNRYDCRSTLGLRDWLLERAQEAGVRDRIVPRAVPVEPREQAQEEGELEAALAARAGGEHREQRTPQEQAWAMLATAIGFHRREAKQFWWGHFDRLGRPVESWAGDRDVFAVESAELVQDWTHPGGRARNLERQVRLVGDWGRGSTERSRSQVVYAAPAPERAYGPEGGSSAAATAHRLDWDPERPREALLVERAPEGLVFADLPVALVPASPPDTSILSEAIARVAQDALGADELPAHPALDLLARRRPRLLAGAELPHGGRPVEDLVSALLALDRSALAVQGPPGTGKTWTGSRVIRRLVEEHGWRVGVVAQSHAVVEHLLAGIVDAGLDPARVGKSANQRTDPPWTEVGNTAAARAAYLEEHWGTGCVLGGTAWTLAHADLVEPGGLDLLVVEEAGQFSLATTIAVSGCASRLLLLGDPQQLPQVSQGTHAEPVDESALGWLMDDEPTLDPALGYFLEESYRMHPAVTAPVSELAYAGQLRSAAPPSARSLDGVEPGLEVVRIEHHGNRTESPEEAQEVVRQVRAYLGATWSDPADTGTPRPLGPADMLVVAPYNAQVELIRRELDAAGITGVRVGTVDRFQGQEAPVAILSMTASSAADVSRGMGFLLSRNRLNVAISRAQWRAVLIRSEALTAHLPSGAESLLQLGAFMALCDQGIPARTLAGSRG
ncbi:Superfamily I DNA and RNA helicase [Serinicoccus hydrothermalis]|uniref:Superfamily I DNA and RNA helicase n=1 Tax=Serinicoccus hydrothermalis TaxID=1758689 RepID=A0A1B1N9Y8_9MICO|nr:bifunctional RecB family nuclease/DEAD/DEAH box helicase [Serinicoccus hydrothermalis]ANS78252.1 Superfamily I DNA and RNA helicase [Serinicoccus hydrothermalis]